MASEEKFDPAAAQAELANLPSQNEITLAGIEALSDNGDLLQLLLTGPAGMPSPGGIVGILGTVSTVISLPAKALLAYNEYTEIKKRYEQPPGPPPPPEGLPGPEGPDDSEDPDALIRKAGALIASERLDDALTVLDDIAARFAADSDQGVARSVRHSRLNALQVLNRLHRWEETLTRYDQIAEIYGADTTPAVSVDMLSARTNRLEALGFLQRNDEAVSLADETVAVCDRLIADHEDLADRIWQFRVAALRMEASVLSRPVKSDEAPAAPGSVGPQSGTDEAVRPPGIADQSLAEADALLQSARWQQAIDAYDKVLASYSKDRSVKRQAIAATCRKVYLLMGLRRFEDALRACHDAERAFRGEEVVLVLAAFCEIDAYRELGRRRKALKACDKAARLLDASADTGYRQAAAQIPLVKAELLREARDRSG